MGYIKKGVFSILNFLFLYVAVLSACHSQGYDLTFYNVGQGDCTIIKTPNKQILFVDAGTSSTIGVPINTTENDETTKINQLASNIVDFIESDLVESKWILFIITHSDKDHLNLVSPILSQFFLTRDNFIDDYKIGIIFGGTKNTYRTDLCKSLFDLLEAYHIKHIFGGTSFQLDESQLFYVFKKIMSEEQSYISAMINEWMKHELGRDISFLSVKSDVIYRKNLRQGEQLSNAESIVLKIKFGSKSLMITGDKTKKEIESILTRFYAIGRLEELTADILLATHHGSEEDFSEEWVKNVNPLCIVCSSGRHSFFHPRKKSIAGYLSNTSGRIYSNWAWHFVQFHGDEIITDRFYSILREAPPTDVRAKGYVHAATNLGIFVTGNQGNIRFNLSTTHFNPCLGSTYPTLSDAINNFITHPRLPNNGIINPEEIFLDNILNVQWLACKMNTLEKLSLNGCFSEETQNIDDLCDYISHMVTIKNLDLRNNFISQKSVQKIKNTWNHRGLYIDSIDKMVTDDDFKDENI